MFAGARCQADGEVQIGLGKIHIFVRSDQRESRVRVRLAKDREPAGQPFGGKITRRGDGKRIGRLPRLHRANRFFELKEPCAQGIKAICGLVCELKPFGGAAEQDNAQHIFKRAYLLPYGCWRHGKLVRSLSKA